MSQRLCNEPLVAGPLATGELNRRAHGRNRNADIASLGIGMLRFVMKRSNDKYPEIEVW